MWALQRAGGSVEDRREHIDEWRLGAAVSINQGLNGGGAWSPADLFRTRVEPRVRLP